MSCTASFNNSEKLLKRTSNPTSNAAAISKRVGTVGLAAFGSSSRYTQDSFFPSFSAKALGSQPRSFRRVYICAVNRALMDSSMKPSRYSALDRRPSSICCLIEFVLADSFSPCGGNNFTVRICILQYSCRQLPFFNGTKNDCELAAIRPIKP